MSSNLRRSVGGFLMLALPVAGALGQGPGWELCINPDADPLRSTDWSVATVFNDLMVSSVGFSGTTSFFGPNSACATTAGQTVNLRGRIGFAVGSQGSIQSAFDNNMQLTFGMPLSPGGTWSYAMITTLNDAGVRTKTLFGANPMNLAFVGASDRYIYVESVSDSVRARCRIDVIGDGARVQWRLTNEGATRRVGLWFGQWIGLLSDQVDPATGADMASGWPTLSDKPPYISVPGQKPALIDTRWIRSQDPTGFPNYIDFNFGQTTAYGLRVENGPTPSTTNPQTGQSDATLASEFVLGNAGLLLGAFSGGDGTMPDVIIPDTIIGSTGYIQKFAELSVPATGQRTITHYFRSTWGQSSYTLPYTAVVDAPRLLATDDDGSSSNESNGLFKNPFQFRVYIDNVGGYSDVNSGFALNDVKVKLTLPTGLNFVGFPTTTRTRQLTISQIIPREITSVDFGVEADGIEFGDLPYQVDITSTPGGSKQIKGTVQVAATARYKLFDVGGAPTTNAITTPFIFSDSSWGVVLGLNSPTDFQAFEWDPQLKGYVISTSAQRGRGAFIINNTGGFLSEPLGGNPTTPTDTPPFPFDNSGRYAIQLKSGWNLIGNPYNYPLTIGQITGVSAANPQVSRTWAQLVVLGTVNSFLAYWDAQTQSYRFLQKATDKIQPNTAYWVFVNTSADLTLAFPPVFEPLLPGSTRSVDDWRQTEKQWRLQLTARTDMAVDDQNFIGRTLNTETANNFRMMEPPMAPTQEVAVSIDGQLSGQPVRLAQSLRETGGKQEFKVFVETKKDGEVTLTWPNLASIPKNVRVRLIDVATSTSKDLRGSSGYTFNGTAGATREFKIQVEEGQNVRPTIGNLIVTRPGSRNNGPGGNSPFTISYTLSAAATTTIRVLGTNGKEVFTVTRGRADAAGEKSVTWNLKDNANRSVAPGTYQVELVATTPEGDNVRRVVPVTVIR